jgi:hypothetical protein
MKSNATGIVNFLCVKKLIFWVFPRLTSYNNNWLHQSFSDNDQKRQTRNMFSLAKVGTLPSSA